MKLSALLVAGLAIFSLASCSKDKTPDVYLNTNALEQNTLNDLSDKVILPIYSDMQDQADALYNAAVALRSSASETRLATTRTAYLAMHKLFLQAEAFAFGPVNTLRLENKMHTWPADTVRINTLLASSTDLADLTLLDSTLKGFHPMEYVLFGLRSSRTAADTNKLTDRQKEYLVGLAQDLRNNARALYTAWQEDGGRYSTYVKQADTLHTAFGSRQEVFLTLVDAMVNLCDEVMLRKIDLPLSTSEDNADSFATESLYSNTSIDNILSNFEGIQFAYSGDYKSDYTGLNQIVQRNNYDLDTRIQDQVKAVKQSLGLLGEFYSVAIFRKRPELFVTKQKITLLRNTLNEDLRTYITENVQD